MIEQNRYYLMRDKDWKKIFKSIKGDENSYARYYPMVRVRADTGEFCVDFEKTA